MPRQTPAAKIWLMLVGFAHNRGGHDFGRWIARHVSEIPGRLNGVAHTVTDLLDWVRAREGSGQEFVTRSFTPAMGLKAATQASQEWHEAVATNADCRQGRELPAPWYPAAKQGASISYRSSPPRISIAKGRPCTIASRPMPIESAKVLAIFFRSARAVNGWRRRPWSAMARGY